MQLTNAALKIIPDSRGENTLEAELTDGKFSATASVPFGKSRGAHEVFVLAPQEALSKFETIKSEILSRDFESQQEFDNFLISLDGTSEKKNLGGNLILAISLTWARLKAKTENKELFEYISEVSNIPLTGQARDGAGKYQAARFPRPIFNVINGGAHAHNKLFFQEFQVIPEVSDFGIAFSLGKEFYKELKELLEKKFGKENVSLGDEAGFSAPLYNNEQALEVLSELIANHKYPLRIGLDVAASQFYQGADLRGRETDLRGYYLIADKEYSSDELKDFYLELIKKYKLLSIEDPFAEEAFDDFSELSRALVSEDVKIITDDLTVTNPKRLKTAVAKKAGNTILIKPNQIGTLTETLQVVKLAYQNGWQVVVSHRSGETRDDFIADLAVGIGAWGIKAGAPAKPERLAKYERLLQIYQLLKH